MLKFLVSADLHYKKNMYASTVAHLNKILDRANREGVQFVVHLGDLCNDYIGSRELVQSFLLNKYDLQVFCVIGNHELESKDNNISVVKELLSNKHLNYGSDDGGYWYYDISDYRLIGFDTNYSYNSGIESWEHNKTASWGAPKGNLYENSLSPKQLYWLDGILSDAKSQGKKVIVFSHEAVSGEWSSSPDSDAVRNLFKKYDSTVLMCLNGHLHTDHFCVKDNIFYLDVNAALNGYWAVSDGQHYADEHTFTREVFDGEGNTVGTEEAQLNKLSQAKNTWFFEEPLSAKVEIGDDGTIKVIGDITEWKYGVLPPIMPDGVIPQIKNRTAKLKL